MLKPMEKMSWLDLYNFLHQKANDLKNLGSFNWQAPVEVYDNHYGGLHNADIVEFFDKNGNKETNLRIDSEGK